MSTSKVYPPAAAARVAVREWTEKVTPEQQWSIAPEHDGRRGRRDRRDPLYDEALRP